jgi:hypothetical protein
LRSSGILQASPKSFALQGSEVVVTPPFDPNKPLFKYLSSTYLPDARERGRFMIGTLVDYRSGEHALAIGDASEGTDTVTTILDDVTDQNYLTHPHASQFIQVAPGATATFRFEDVAITQSGDTHDSYVFCMTDKPTPEGQSAFGYDACIQIRDPQRFADLITQALQNAVAKKGLTVGAPDMRRCEPGSRDRTLDDAKRTPRVFLKDKSFAYQHEVRIVWSVEGGPIEPLLLDCPEVIPLLDDFTVPIPADFKKGESPHAPQLLNTELLQRTYDVVEKLAHVMATLQDAESHRMSVHDQTQYMAAREQYMAARDQARAEFLRALADLKIEAEIALLAREYLVRWLRDPRFDAARSSGISRALNPWVIAAGLQRFAERLEILSGAPKNLHRDGSYRFWYPGPSGFSDAAHIRELTLKASRHRRTMSPPHSAISTRGSMILVPMDDELREALEGLVDESGAPAIDVIEELLGLRPPEY